MALTSQLLLLASRRQGESARLVASLGAQQVAAADDHASGHMLSLKSCVGVVAAELGRWARDNR